MQHWHCHQQQRIIASGTPTLHLVSDLTTQDPNCPSAYIRVRTWNFTDAENNTSANFVQTITVQDNTAPSFNRPADITIYTNSNCTYDASTSITGEATNVDDNCSTGLVPTFADVTVPGPVEGSWIITRTWKLVDNCGNAAPDQIQTITVSDNIVPTVSAPPTDKIVSANANCQATGVNLGILGASDNCTSVLTITNNKPSVYPDR